MLYTDDAPSFQKKGFLEEEFRLFHIRDHSRRSYDFHYHDFLKIMVLLEGRVDYVIEGRSYTLAPYDLVLVDRGEIHRPEVYPSFPYERTILYLSPDFMEQSGVSLNTCFQTAAYRHSSVLRIKDDARQPLFSLLRRLEKAIQHQKEEFAGPLYVRLLCLEFLVELNRVCLAPASQYLASGSLDYRVSGLIAYINEHLSEDLSIPLLSDRCCLSPYHMMRIFKEETGYTIGSYITEKRLMRARDLLSGGMGATETCFMCGFRNYSTFLRAYKRRFEELPRRSLKNQG